MDFSRWDALIDRIAQEMHQGKLKPADLDKEAINTTYKELDDAGKKGYGKDWTSFPGDGKGELPNELKKNLYMFSGAKTYAMLEQLNGLLYDKDGKLRPYNEYEVFARKLNRQYNRNWLQAEWQTARTAAQMAQKWERLQENKDLFPNLEFRTVGDDRVRKDHQELHGIIKPIDDAFWSEYYPPLDWRCFEPETEILTQQGWRRIKDIQRTDLIIGGSGKERLVGDVITNDFSGNLITLISKRHRLSCTPNHRFLTTKGWVMAGDIEVGNIVVQVGKTGFFNKIPNAVHNAMVMLQYGLMSFKRKWKSI